MKSIESKNVQIVAYESKYQPAFKSLNEEWISAYFEMEEADYKALDNPEEYILSKGGKIFVALCSNEPLGVCAMIKMDAPNYDFELAKMAVSPKAQGKGIGWLLGQAIINAAKELGASKLYLESNTILKPAINLYYKLGFQKIAGHPTPYKRCNIQMELKLNDWKMYDKKVAIIMKRIITKKEEAGKKVFKGVSLDVLSIADKSMVTKMNYVNGDFATIHSHPNEQSGYVVSGQYRLIIDSPERKIDEVLNPGDSYAIPENYPHSFEVIEGGEVIDVFTPIREDYL
jgi:GNAT superfamily N-acetyltransferase/quercetin dioxygenase-like cupin family protein